MIVPMFAGVLCVQSMLSGPRCKRIVNDKGKSQEKRTVVMGNSLFSSCQPAPGKRRRAILHAGLSGFLAATCFFALNVVGHAQAPVPAEYRVKAEFLANFAKFVEWPDDSFAGGKGDFVIGILGNYRFGISLSEAVSGRTVRGRKIKIRILTSKDSPRDCQILFIGGSDRKQFIQILTSLRGASVLTVGEAEGFLQSGGTISFLVEEERVRFEVNLDGANRARLKMSSQLLAMARSIRNDTRAPKT